MKLSLKLAHLYPKRMNIYGDRGNIVTLQRRAEWRGIGLEVEQIEANEPLDAPRYDLFFFGGGQDVEQFTVAKDLAGKADSLREAHRQGAAMLAVCGGYQLFGRSYRPNFAPPDGGVGDATVGVAGLSGSAVGTTGPLGQEAANQETPTELAGVGIFPAVTVGGPERLIGNVVARSQLDELNDHPLVGFENHSGLTTLDDGAQPLATVQHGYGNNGQDGGEGCVAGNAIGTYLHGSLLPKNPHLADWLLRRALAHRYPGAELLPLPRPADTFELAANQAIAGRFG